MRRVASLCLIGLLSIPCLAGTNSAESVTAPNQNKAPDQSTSAKPDSASIPVALPPITPASPSPNIYSYVGTGRAAFAGDNGPAAAAAIDSPGGLTLDTTGNLYFADMYNGRVRKVDLASSIVTTVAGTGGSYVRNNGDGGLATAAWLALPGAVAVDHYGNLYIADLGTSSVRRVDAFTGVITTFAGTGKQGYSGDGGPATNAELNWPYGLAIDSAGSLYISDYFNNRIRKVDSESGIIETIAGSGAKGYGGDGGLATGAELYYPQGIALDGSGNLYIADFYNSRIRKVNATTGIINTFAGNGSQGLSGDGGPSTSAALGAAEAVSADSSGNLYIADTLNHRIRRVDSSTGIINTVAGAGAGFGGDYGPATSADLLFPSGVAVDAKGSFYFSDTGNHRIRIVGALPEASRLDTETSLIASAGDLVSGRPLYLNAQVTSASGTIPAGIVTFRNGITVLGSATLTPAGTAALMITPTGGEYFVTARYGGSPLHSASSSLLGVSVTVTHAHH